MGGGEERADHARRLDGIDGRLDLHINAVDFVLQIAGLVFEAPHHGVERGDDHVVAVERLDALGIGIAAVLRAQDADHLEPGIVGFDVLAERVAIAEEADLGGFAEDANRGRIAVLVFGEEAPAGGDFQAVDFLKIGVDTDQRGRLAGGFGQQLLQLELFAGSDGHQALDVLGDGSIVS